MSKYIRDKFPEALRLPTKRTLYERLWEHLKYDDGEFLYSRRSKRSGTPTIGILGPSHSEFFWDVLVGRFPSDSSDYRGADWRLTSNGSSVNILGEQVYGEYY